MQQHYQSILIQVFIVVELIAGIFAGIVMYIAVDHNPMGEYCEFIDVTEVGRSCIILWPHLLALGGMAFVWCSLLLGMLFSVVVIVVRSYTKH